MQSLIKSKLKAATIHLTLSAITVGSALILVCWAWYPSILLHPTGATKIFLIVLSVDICLGPILTFVVYDSHKKGLRGDLSIIALIQIVALVYGVYTLANARPVYLVYAVDRFEVVQANDLTESNIRDAVLPEFKLLPWSGPKWISTRVPTDSEQSIGPEAAVGSADIAQLPKFYSNLETSVELRIKRAKSVETLKNRNPNQHALINSLVEKYRGTGQEIAYVPLTARERDLSVILDAKSGSVLQIIDLEPWE